MADQAIHAPPVKDNTINTLLVREASADITNGLGIFPCPVDPCPYTEAHKASHES